MGRWGFRMKKQKSVLVLFVLLLVFGLVSAGCAEWEEADSTAATQANAAGDEDDTDAAGCESYEEEVEPGVCAYTIDCDDAKSCELWEAKMIKNMDKWFGELTYSEEWDIDEKAAELDPDEIASYKVKGNRIELKPKNEDEQYYAWLWDRFAWIIPYERRQMINRFEVYDHADLMAFVVQDDEDYDKWTYAANQIQATYETERVMTDIHEFGHLLSLNAEQVDPNVSAKNCKTYMLDEGCPKKDSYIYKFYQQFWEDGEDEDENRYVTEYAMSSVYEDFAESWAYFVMTPRPKGKSVADRKVTFFYAYDDLIMLKASLLARAASWMDRNIEYEE